MFLKMGSFVASLEQYNVRSVVRNLFVSLIDVAGKERNKLSGSEYLTPLLDWWSLKACHLFLLHDSCSRIFN